MLNIEIPAKGRAQMSRANHIDEIIALEELREDLPADFDESDISVGKGIAEIDAEEEFLPLSQEIRFWPDLGKKHKE